MDTSQEMSLKHIEEQLPEMVKERRLWRRLGVRKAAKEIGLSPATVSRIERHYKCDTSSFILCLRWLGYTHLKEKIH